MWHYRSSFYTYIWQYTNSEGIWKAFFPVVEAGPILGFRGCKLTSWAHVWDDPFQIRENYVSLLIVQSYQFVSTTDPNPHSTKASQIRGEIVLVLGLFSQMEFPPNSCSFWSENHFPSIVKPFIFPFPSPIRYTLTLSAQIHEIPFREDGKVEYYRRHVTNIIPVPEITIN